MNKRRGDGNPYRGWALVERNGGLYMTRDNLTYRLVSHEQWSSRSLTEFHRLVDEMEGDVDG